MTNEPGTKNFRWYQTAWGVALIGLGALVLVSSTVFGFLTARYWVQIRKGEGKNLQQKIYGGFDRSVKEIEDNSKVNRKELEAGDRPFLGNPNAPITVVAFFDYKCPNSKAAVPIIQKLVDRYGYKVKIIIKNFPGESIHPGAAQLAQIAQCAYKQDQYKFWELYNLFFEKQDQLSAPLSDNEISILVGQAGFNSDKINQCLEDGKSEVEVNKDYAQAFNAGVSGTPTFFVNGDRVEGVVPLDTWEGFVKNY